MPHTNNGKPIHPNLPKDAELLWMHLECGYMRLLESERCQYLTAPDMAANDGRHSEELPILNTQNSQIVGVIHLHWNGQRQLQYMHAKEDMLGASKYPIPFNGDLWRPVVKHILQ